MGAKDWLVEKAAVAMLNQSMLKPYGTLTRLKLDTANRTIEGELELKGETQVVKINVHGYELLEEDGGVYLIINGLSTSREWLTTLARDFAVGKKIRIPESVRPFLKMIS